MQFIYPLLNIIFFIMILQITTITHELGHALPAVLFTEGTVRIILGRNIGKTKRISLGRLDIELNSFDPMIGGAQWSELKISKVKKIMIYADGPIVS